MEPILILLLHGSTLSILGPFLCTFTEKKRNSSFDDFATMFDPNIWEQMAAHFHQRKLQTCPEEDELVVGTAE